MLPAFAAKHSVARRSAPAQRRPAHFTPRVMRLIEARNLARAAHDFARADALRDELHALGFVIEDDPAGSRIRPR